MKNFIVKRIAKDSNGVYGVFIDENTPFCLTLENIDYYIPAGTYLCKRTTYYKGGYETFEITSVPNMTRILFHKGNLQEDSEGCIILGEEFDPVLGDYGVKSSGNAFDEFKLKLIHEDKFGLKIIDYIDEPKSADMAHGASA